MTKIIFSEFGRRIREIRGNLTQSEFGELIGVDQTSISNYEKKGRIPEAAILQKIAEFGGTTVESLLKGREVNKTAYHINEMTPQHVSAPYLNRDLLEEIITAVERRLAKMKKTLSPSRKAFCIVNLYDELFASDRDLTPELVDHHIKSVS